MRRAGAAVLAAVLALTLAGCGRQDRPQSGKLNVVCTLFPYYDFVRQIGGDAVDVQLLVPAGRETHSFEPTPLDVIAVSEAEVFIYNGGESELWVEDILDAAGEAIPYRLAMMDCVETYREGMFTKKYSTPARSKGRERDSSRCRRVRITWHRP